MNHSAEKILTLEEKVKTLENTINDLKQKIDYRFPAQITQTNEDIAYYEALFDIIASPRPNFDNKPIATQEEIQHYLDQYKQIWTTLVMIMIDKGITTEKEVNCAMLAYHHFLQKYGINTGKDRQDLFIERQEYIKKLMQMKNPLEKLGF